ncbi:MAG: peptidase [Mesorhizobium amorphae]|nr:MAG: peptidase [Mesorhizobium amorphae]
MLRSLSFAAAGLLLFSTAAGAASVSRSYSYFTVGGATLSEIEADLGRLGPHVESTGRRHPGSTAMAFTNSLTFTQTPGACRIEKAVVRVSAKVTLPRWKRPQDAEQATGLIWGTLAADIKRHEESHVGIAKAHAHELEKALMRLGRFPTCDAANTRAQEVTARILEKHDEEQARFDRVEAKNFESRIMRLLQYKLQRMEAARRTQ